jgi:hypothetical protein
MYNCNPPGQFGCSSAQYLNEIATGKPQCAPVQWFSTWSTRTGPEQLLFLPSSSSVVLTRLSGPRSSPTSSQKSGSAGNRTRKSDFVASNSDH